MFVVVSDVDSKHGLSGCAHQWFSPVTRQWFVGKVFVQFWPAMACFATRQQAPPSYTLCGLDVTRLAFSTRKGLSDAENQM